MEVNRWLPERVKVGLFDYEISEWETKDANANNRFGEVNHDTLRIRIDVTYGHQRAALSLLHEMLHCVECRWNVCDGDDEERRVRVYSEGFAAVWRDNPQVMDWIRDGLAGKGSQG